MGGVSDPASARRPTAAPEHPDPPPGASRALAPDLARGAMLLLIAVANVPWYLWGSTPADTTVHPAHDVGLDRAVSVATIVFVDGRVYPMFAFLFGYGMVQFAQSRLARGIAPRSVRRMLTRRHLAMLAFGVGHAALLWFGDILGAYGLAGLVLVLLFFRRRTGTLLVWACLGTLALLVFTLVSVWGARAVDAADVSPAELGSPAGSLIWAQSTAVNGGGDYLASITERLLTWLPLILFQGLLLPVVPVAILLGWVASRHRVLEDPARHRRLLTWTAIAGIAIGWLGGAYAAAGYLGLLGWSPYTWWTVMVISLATGLPAGVGYVAAFALLSLRVRAAGPLRPLVAVGRRSLTCYLGQSLILAPLMCAWGVGLGGWVGSAGAAGLAVLAYLVLTVFASWLERTGRRGPAEIVLRRLTYGRAAPVT